MTKKKRRTHQKMAKALVSVFVLAVVLLPTLLTANWLIGIVNDRDPRRVVALQAFQPRKVDQTNAQLKPFDEPIVTITFDDGWESVYTQAFPVLQKHGLKTTQYIISDTLDEASYMSAAQLRQMHQAGHEIGGHTASHADLTTLDDEQLKHELSDSQQILQRLFGSVRDFTSPYGAYNAHTLAVISKYYRSQKNAEGDPKADDDQPINVKDSFNPLNIVSYSVRQSTTDKDLQKLLADAKEHNGWVILTYHQIDYSGEQYAISPEDFDHQMALVSNSNLRSATVGQVFDALDKAQRN